MSTVRNRFRLLMLLSVVVIAVASVAWLVLRDRPVQALSVPPPNEARAPSSSKAGHDPSKSTESCPSQRETGRTTRFRERVLRPDLSGEKDILAEAADRNTAANELFSLSELPDGVVGDLARMFRSPDEDEVWRDYCLQFLGSALEREDGVTDEDRALARETLVEALASTNATFAGTALRALHRGDPSDPLVASNALRIARDPFYPSSSRTAALLILEDCVRATASTASTASTLAETASAISSDPSASSLLRRTAEAVQKRSSVQSHDQWNDQGGSQ